MKRSIEIFFQPEEKTEENLHRIINIINNEKSLNDKSKERLTYHWNKKMFENFIKFPEVVGVKFNKRYDVYYFLYNNELDKSLNGTTLKIFYKQYEQSCSANVKDNHNNDHRVASTNFLYEVNSVSDDESKEKTVYHGRVLNKQTGRWEESVCWDVNGVCSIKGYNLRFR